MESPFTLTTDRTALQYQYTTKPGRAHYPHVHAKDTRFSKKPDKSDAFFKCGIVQEGAGAKEFINLVKAGIKDALARGLHESPPKLPGEWDAENEILTLKGCKSMYAPALFDANNNPIPEGTQLGGGSLIRLALNLKTYDGFGNTGVTPYLQAIQVLEFVEAGGTAESFGFDATEGFTVSEDSPFSNETTSLVSDDSADPFDAAGF